MSTTKLSRKEVLRGILGGFGFSLALPPLEAMFNSHGTAYAAGTAIPKRLGMWFWGNGVRLDQWTPAATGANWVPKAALEPLAGSVKPYVNVLSGMNSPWTNNEVAHHMGKAAMTTGTWWKDGDTYGTVYKPSIDMIAAKEWKGKTRFSSLELGVSTRGFENSYNNGWLSANGPNSYNTAEKNPRALFDRIFGTGFMAGGGTTVSNQMTQARRSILDVVSEDAKRLKARVGVQDRVRLDQHMDGIRAVENQLEKMASSVNTCTAPVRPGLFPESDGREQLEPINQAMSDLLAIALACDLTRVFSYEFTGMQVDTFFWQVGATNGLHTMTHDEASPQPKVAATVVFTMKQFAYLLEKLRSIPEGAGNVLDNCCIYATSEMADGNYHSYTDMPIILAGRAGGALRSGQHYRSNGESTSKVLFTALKAVGVPITSVGQDAGLATSGVTAIEV